MSGAGIKEHSDGWYAEILKKYLGQYVNATCRRNQLERRLKRVCQEINSPIGGMDYSPVNTSSGNVSSGSAAFTLRKSELETRIAEQKSKVEDCLLRTMDILDYLDENSTERMIMELKYIDNCSWEKVAYRAHRSRSSCIEWHDKGIAKLITFKRVRVIVEEYARESCL